uniref:Integrator complex subunit 11 n=1 Tax=Panagrolaimus sp. PS1159 TaxID=55785 RepID=A0AC35G2A8_9BILA
MFDCGMHMGYSDERRFPAFSQINGGGNLTKYLDCVIISHFHLDHCGALPHMTEQIGYDGPIYMTYPSKSIVPVLLEDFRKVQTDYKGETNFFTSDMIKKCMRKVIPVDLHQVINVTADLTIQPFYAGHVLGAAMFLIKTGGQSILYTGDFNMTPDRHLGAATVLPGLKPDVLITETTYASTIRDSKRARERDFLRKVHEVVKNGGKVLIPVFALGRAQELCILLESYWDRLDLNIPVFFSPGLAEKANQYYRLFIGWTNENIKETFAERNMFDFKHIKPFDLRTADSPGPMVLFSTPGMLHGGQSLRVFKKWCEDEKNMIIMPGYCVGGTIGARVIKGEKKIEIDDRTYDIRLKVEYMSFSAHADAKGIIQLIRHVEPRNVMFVHGENIKMEFLKSRVEKDLGLPVYKPANGEKISIPTPSYSTLTIPQKLYTKALMLDPNPHKRNCPLEFALVKGDDGTLTVTDVDSQIEETLHSVTFSENVKVDSIDWPGFTKKLKILDPTLEVKEDGLDLFDSTVLLTHAENETNELEVIFDLSRESTLPKIYELIGAKKEEDD